MKEEIIVFIVKVKIDYPSSKERRKAITKAKHCVLASSILGTMISVNPKSAKYLPQ